MLDLTSLRELIASSKKNITIFEDAIKKERTTIADYEAWISNKNSRYNIDSLKAGIVQAEQHIKKFEDSISKELTNIVNTRETVKLLEKRDREQRAAYNNVTIEVVRDNDGA